MPKQAFAAAKKPTKQAVLFAPAPCPLTERELEILAAAAEGCSNRKIAARFGLSEQTVKNHVTNVMHKLRAPDRTGAVVMALRYRWLDLADIRVEERVA